MLKGICLVRLLESDSQGQLTVNFLKIPIEKI